MNTIIPQPYVRFDSPICLCLTLATPENPRGGADDVWQEFAEFPLHLRIGSLERTITAHLPPIPTGILLYGPDDFSAACADTMEDHILQILRILGPDPSVTLQALIDGDELPSPPIRVPLEIANWRAKAILYRMGRLDEVNTIIASLPDPDGFETRLAWNGDASLLRRSPSVLFLASALNLSDTDLDAFFIAAAALVR